MDDRAIGLCQSLVDKERERDTTLSEDDVDEGELDTDISKDDIEVGSQYIHTYYNMLRLLLTYV